MKVTLIFPYQFYVTIVRLKITFFKTSHHTGFKEIQPKQLTGFYMRHVFTEDYFRKNYRIKLKYKPFLAKRIKSEFTMMNFKVACTVNVKMGFKN